MSSTQAIAAHELPTISMCDFRLAECGITPGLIAKLKTHYYVADTPGKSPSFYELLEMAVDLDEFPDLAEHFLSELPFE